jgi:adenosylcobinamide-GDP ribazoletransferase
VQKRVRQEIRIFLGCVGFFTAMPLPPLGPAWQANEAELKKSLKYFGLIGVMVGGVAILVAHLSHGLWGASVAATAAVIAGMTATRCFHEDGLADFADGLGGAFSKERVLEIMKDPRHGTYGVMALVCTFGLKVQALIPVASDLDLMGACLLAAHVLSRIAAWSLTLVLSDARPSTLQTKSQVITGDKSFGGIAINGAVMGILVTLWPVPIGLCLLGIFLFTMVMAWYLRFRLGGYTGDCLGAAQQMGEVVVVLVFSARTHLC